jgi:SAM-dependent methyltransferase
MRARWKVHELLDAFLQRAPTYRATQALLGAPRSKRLLVAEQIRPHAGIRILDVGCGPGAILDALPEDVVYLGVDPNPLYVREADDRFGYRARFVIGMAERLGAATGESWDIVMGCGLLHHLSDSEARRFVEEAHRLLVAGGRLITIDPCRGARDSMAQRILHGSDRGANIRTPDGYRALVDFAKWSILQRVDRGRARLLGLVPLPYAHCVMECVRFEPALAEPKSAATRSGAR